MASLLERARREGTPLVDGKKVTFVWAGERPPRLMGDFTNWQHGQPATMKEAEPGVWTYTCDLPRDAFIEYAFITNLEQADTDDGRALDPYNPLKKWNGFNATNNIFYMPEAHTTPLIKRKRGIAKGKLTRYKVEVDSIITGKKRDVWLYQPPVSQSVPLLVVYDGRDYLKQAKLAAIVDNLIAAGRVAPFALALLANARQARFLEYACSDATLGFLQHKILPLAQQELNLLDLERNPGAFGVMGASMGGVMSLYTGLRLPHIFGKVLSQSGAFAIFGQELVVYDLVSEGATRPLHIWLDCGRYEFLLETNRRMYKLLQDKGYHATYREYPAGHNYFAWRDDVANGLEALFPPEKS